MGGVVFASIISNCYYLAIVGEQRDGCRSATGLGIDWTKESTHVDYSKALNDLDPILRFRLRAIARIAGMSELEALKTIVEAGVVDDDTGPSSDEGPL